MTLTIPLPVRAGPEFEGEILQKENCGLIFGRQGAPVTTMVRIVEGGERNDDPICIECPQEISLQGRAPHPLAILVELAGKVLKPEFQPLMERHIQRSLSRIRGIACQATDDGLIISMSRDALIAGLTIRHLASWLAAEFQEEFGALLERIRIAFFAAPDDVRALRKEYRQRCRERIRRSREITDESVDRFYSCTMCQSYVPYHVCIIKPEKPGICGAYSWIDAQFRSIIDKHGPFNAVLKGTCIDNRRGEWSSVNGALKALTSGRVERFSGYSAMDFPETSCGCAECIIAIVPEARGFLAVSRSYEGMTPIGMTFDDLIDVVGRGRQVPGFLGMAFEHLMSRTFISAHGGHLRLLWMPKEMKHVIGKELTRHGEDPAFLSLMEKIADEEDALNPESLRAFLQKKEHPVLTMDALI